MEEITQSKTTIKYSSAKIKNRLHTLEQLSRRLKFLQLCKTDYDKTIELYIKYELDREQRVIKGEIPDDEDPNIISYHNVKIMKHLTEILSTLTSIRDGLKINFFATCSNDNIKGFLQDDFKEINIQHKKLFKQTIGAKKNSALRDFVTYFRNEFLHHDLHNVKFHKVLGPSHELLHFFIFSEFNDFQKHNKNKLWGILTELYAKYLLDHETMALKIRAGDWRDENFRNLIFNRALNTPNAESLICDLTLNLHSLKKTHSSIDSYTDYALPAFHQFGTDLLKIPEFLFYYVNLKESIIHANKRELLETEIPENYCIYLNIGQLIEDACAEHFNYYIQLYYLIFGLILEDLPEHLSLNKMSVPYFCSLYSCELPETPNM